MDGKYPLAGGTRVRSGLFREKELAGAARRRRLRVAARRSGAGGLATADALRAVKPQHCANYFAAYGYGAA